MNIFFAVADFITQVILVVVGIVLVLDPDLLVANIDFGTTPDPRRLPDRDPGGDGRLHRHRDDLEHGRGGEGLRQDDPARHRPRGRRRRGDLRVPAGRGAVGDAGENGETLLALPKERGATPTTRCSAWWRTWSSASLQAPAEIYVGILAATILFIATNAGLIGVSRLTYSMGQHRQLPERLRAAPSALPHAVRRDPRLRRVACLTILPGPGRLPRHDLRLRGDAVVHDRARSR